MRLHDVNSGIVGHRPTKRLGRGTGTGQGKTAGRGHKGQKSRAGYSRKRGFQGGQMPLIRRVPKRGFGNPFALDVAEVSLSDLAKHFAAGSTVDLQSLKSCGLVGRRADVAKILANGTIDRALRVVGARVSAKAKELIAAAGGSVEVSS